MRSIQQLSLVTFVLGVLFTLGLLMPGYAEPHKKKGPPSAEQMEKRVERISKSLELTDKQKEKFESIMAEKHEKIKVLREEFKAKMKETNEEYSEKVSSILTSKQQEKFEKMKEKRKAKRAAKRQAQ